LFPGGIHGVTDFCYRRASRQGALPVRGSALDYARVSSIVCLVDPSILSLFGAFSPCPVPFSTSIAQYFQWVPGHTGLSGNKFFDILAKAVFVPAGVLYPLVPSVAKIKKHTQ